MTKWWPYKLLTHLLYGGTGIHRLQGGEMIVRTNELAIALKIKNDKLKEYLRDLQDMEFIQSIQENHGYTIVKMRMP